MGQGGSPTSFVQTLVPLHAFLDYAIGLHAIKPAVGVGELAFEILVDVEEVVHFLQGVSGNVLQPHDFRLSRVADRHPEDLVIESLVIPHFKNAHRSDFNKRSRIGGAVQKNEYVERVFVFGVGSRNESVGSGNEPG